MTRNFEDGVLERISDVLGTALLEFMMNADIDTLATGTITEKQKAYLLELEKLGRSLNYDEATIKQVLRAHFVDVSQQSQPLALAIHAECGGTLPTFKTENDLERAIVDLALNLYPSFLLPPEDYGFPISGYRDSIHVSRGLFSHPAAAAFEAAALADGVLAPAFKDDRPSVGRTVMVHRSTFQGGTVQLSMLAGHALQSAWRDREDEKPLEIGAFVQSSLTNWRFIYAAFCGKKQSVRARTALAGALLPVCDPVDFGDVVVRQMTSLERSFAPESIKGGLTGTDAAGNTVMINYEGDLVAEAQHPYFLKVEEEWGDETPPEFPAEMLVANPLEDRVLRLRLALVLGVKREHRVQVVPTWRLFDDPLSHGYPVSWSDPKQTVNLMPTQLTSEEVTSWRHWYELLSEKKADKLGLAISRVVKAIGERRDPVDVLIDSVIAWENLFGSKEGEPTLRVTASLALLLEDDYVKRRKLRTRLAKIYALRSDTVHGTAMPTTEEIALCNEALDIALQALKAILEQRPDLLDEPDSTSRSLRLLLGGGPLGIEAKVGTGE